MGRVSQHQARFEWPDANMIAPIDIKGLGGTSNRPWRPLRAAWSIASTGSNSVRPYVQLLDGGLNILGEWWAAHAVGQLPMDTESLGRVTIDTVPPGYLPDEFLVASSGAQLCRFAIPQDLIVMDAHTLRIGMDAAQAGDGAYVVGSSALSGVFLTYILED